MTEKTTENLRIRGYSHWADYELLIEGLRSTNEFRADVDTLDRYRQVARTAPDAILVADLGRRAVVGSLEIGTDSRLGEIRRVNVHADSQRRGIGSSLVREAIKRVLAKGLKPELLVDDGPKAEWLLPFYERLGFEIEYRAYGLSYPGRLQEGSVESHEQPQAYVRAFTAIHDTLMSWPADNFYIKTSRLNALLANQENNLSQLKLDSFGDDPNIGLYAPMHPGHFHDTTERGELSPVALVWMGVKTTNVDRYKLLRLVELSWGDAYIEPNNISGLYVCHDVQKDELLTFRIGTREQDPNSIYSYHVLLLSLDPDQQSLVLDQLMKGTAYLDDRFKERPWHQLR